MILSKTIYSAFKIRHMAIKPMILNQLRYRNLDDLPSTELVRTFLNHYITTITVSVLKVFERQNISWNIMSSNYTTGLLTFI